MQHPTYCRHGYMSNCPWGCGVFVRLVLSAILLIALIVPASAQVQPPIAPPKTPTPAVKFKALAPLTVKAGDHIVLDASSAKGKIDFLFDAAVFPKERATQQGKVLILSTMVNGTYTISVVSYDDGVTEKVSVKVTDGGPLPPPPPPPTDPLEALKLEMRAGFARMDAGFTSQQAENAAMKMRLTLLEQIKPKPPPDPPVPPTDAIALAIHGAWQQEFAADKKDTAVKMAICYRAAVEKIASATSWGDLSSAIKNTAATLNIAGKLPAVSKAINTQLLAAGFPASPSVLMAPGDAEKARAVFGKVISALEALP